MIDFLKIFAPVSSLCGKESFQRALGRFSSICESNGRSSTEKPQKHKKATCRGRSGEWVAAAPQMGCPLAVTPADFWEAWWALLADFYPKSKRHTGQGPLNRHLLVQGLLVPLTSLHLLEARSSMRTSVVWADSLALSEAGH